MKLYYATGACSLVVRITLHQLKFIFSSEAVNLKTKITATGLNFNEINRKGAVPTLQLDNGEILTENTVILQYLADTYATSQLLPAINTSERYRILEWLNFVSTDLHKNCTPLFSLVIPAALKDQFFKPMLKKKLKLVEEHLQTQTYLATEQCTLADNYLFVVLRWLPKLGVELSELPNLRRFFNLMQQQIAVKTALQEEGLLNQ